METNPSRKESMQTYAVLYSYPTCDRYYRGQRGERVVATSQADALAKIRAGHGYPACPGAELVRCKVVAS